MLDGLMCSHGWGRCGQCGHGTLNNVQNPRLIEALQGKVVTAVAAGGIHSAAIADGCVYTWGNSTYGELCSVD
jgi:alpha-tubulin suppressor-like RCC1 family protein